MAFNYAGGQGVIEGIMAAAQDRKQRKQTILNSIMTDPQAAMLTYGENAINTVSKMPDVQRMAAQREQSKQLEYLTRLGAGTRGNLNPNAPLDIQNIVGADRRQADVADAQYNDARQWEQAKVLMQNPELAANIPSGNITPDSIRQAAPQMMANQQQAAMNKERTTMVTEQYKDSVELYRDLAQKGYPLPPPPRPDLTNLDATIAAQDEWEKILSDMGLHWEDISKDKYISQWNLLDKDGRTVAVGKQGQKETQPAKPSADAETPNGGLPEVPGLMVVKSNTSKNGFSYAIDPTLGPSYFNGQKQYVVPDAIHKTMTTNPAVINTLPEGIDVKNIVSETDNFNQMNLVRQAYSDQAIKIYSEEYDPTALSPAMKAFFDKIEPSAGWLSDNPKPFHVEGELGIKKYFMPKGSTPSNRNINVPGESPVNNGNASGSNFIPGVEWID